MSVSAPARQRLVQIVHHRNPYSALLGCGPASYRGESHNRKLHYDDRLGGNGQRLRANDADAHRLFCDADSRCQNRLMLFNKMVSQDHFLNAQRRPLNRLDIYENRLYQSAFSLAFQSNERSGS
jgi:hypothetical protein